MLRKMAILSVVVAVLVPACEKRTPPEKPDDKRASLEQQTPEGMTVLPVQPGAPVFITRQAVSGGAYSEFLKATGVAPKRSLDSEKPILGLSLNEASAYATWRLMRLPTAREWEQGRHIVGAAPYPWGAEVSAETHREMAQLFLVKDYLPGSDGEKGAQQKKKELIRGLFREHHKEIEGLRAELQKQVERHKVEQQQWWRTYKLALFELVQQKRELAQLESLKARLQAVISLLEQVEKEKMKLVRLKTSEASDAAVEKAAEEYKKFLAAQREAVGKVVRDLQMTNKKLQNEGLALKKKLEEAGAKMLSEAGKAGERAVQEAAAKVQDFEAARVAREKLEKVAEALRGARVPPFDLKSLKVLAEKVEKLKKRVQELTASQQVAGRIKTLRERIARFSDHLKKQFLNEKLLFKDLDDMAEGKARQTALEKELEELKATVKTLKPPTEGQKEAPAAPE